MRASRAPASDGRRAATRSASLRVKSSSLGEQLDRAPRMIDVAAQAAPVAQHELDLGLVLGESGIGARLDPAAQRGDARLAHHAVGELPYAGRVLDQRDRDPVIDAEGSLDAVAGARRPHSSRHSGWTARRTAAIEWDRARSPAPARARR